MNIGQETKKGGMSKFGKNKEGPGKSYWRERKNVQIEGRTLPMVR